MSMLLARPGWNNQLLTKLLKCTVSTENHSNATIHHCSIPTTGNTLSPTKKPHILRLQKPPSSPRLRAAKRNICVRDRTQNWLSSCSFLSCPFCLLLFYSLDNMLDDCWVRKWPFIPFLFPFVCLFVSHDSQTTTSAIYYQVQILKTQSSLFSDYIWA